MDTVIGGLSDLATLFKTRIFCYDTRSAIQTRFFGFSKTKDMRVQDEKDRSCWFGQDWETDPAILNLERASGLILNCDRTYQ